VIELLLVTDVGATPMSIVVGLGATVSATVVLALTAGRLRVRWLRLLSVVWAVWTIQHVIALVGLRMPIAAEAAMGAFLLVLRETMLAFVVRELGGIRALWLWVASLLLVFIAAALGVESQKFIAFAYFLRAAWWGGLTAFLATRDTTLGAARRLAAVGTGVHALVLFLAAWMHTDARFISVAAGLTAAMHFSVALGTVAGARETLLHEEESAIRRVALALEYVARGFVPMCAHCHSVRDGTGTWRGLAAFAAESTAVPVADVICPTCQAVR
jgi:hypothetical protein